MLAALTLLTPLGALAGLAAALPLVALAIAVRRGAQVRTTLGLRAPRTGTDLVALASLVGVFVLVSLAATQPALSHDERRHVRKDAQALFVLDISRSMSASARYGAPTRLERATALAAKLRAGIPDVEAGVATLTDRVLPDLLPVADIGSFDATLQRSVGIEQPPPQAVNVRATTFDAVTAIPASNVFAPEATRRVVVLLTDGETRPFDAGALGGAFEKTALVVVGVRRDGEAVYVGAGRPEAGYGPDPSASASLGALAAATGGRAYGESDGGAVEARLSALLGKGPTKAVVGRARRETTLAPYVAVAALLPLALLARRRFA